MSFYLLVGLGGAVGSVARAWVGVMAVRWLGEAFPWGTLIVNVTGSLLIGVLAALPTGEGRPLIATPAGHLLVVGVCGGYTTFSSFSLQTLVLLQEGRVAAALVNVGASVAACLAAVWAGHAATLALRS